MAGNILTRAMNVQMTCEDSVPAQSALWPRFPKVIYNFYWILQYLSLQKGFIPKYNLSTLENISLNALLHILYMKVCSFEPRT